MLSFEELCDMASDECQIDYLVFDSGYHVRDFSKRVSRYFDEELEAERDVREYLYEFIGYEDTFEKLQTGEEKSFQMKKVNKNDFYIDLYIRYHLPGNVYVVLINDMTQRVQEEQAILQDRNKNELLLRELSYKNYLLDKYRKATYKSIPMVHVTPGFDIVSGNMSFVQLSGYSEYELRKKTFGAIVDEPFVQSDILKYMVQDKIYTTNLNLKTNIGTLVHVNAIFIPTFNEKNQLEDIIIFTHDITIHKNDKEHLLNIAYRDGLTKLYNRIGLDDRLDFMVEQNEPFVLMFLDLDFFKEVNDRHGHDLGDRLLQCVSGRLERCIPAEGFIARYGGDEFIVLLRDNIDTAGITKVAEKIIESVSSRYQIDDKAIMIGVSVGIACYPKDADGKFQLLNKADQAMYRSKSQGRNRYSFYGDITDCIEAVQGLEH